MADIVNLRIARKRRERAVRAKDAEANRATHGASNADKIARRVEAERAKRHLDGIKRERED